MSEIPSLRTADPQGRECFSPDATAALCTELEGHTVICQAMGSALQRRREAERRLRRPLSTANGQCANDHRPQFCKANMCAPLSVAKQRSGGLEKA